MHNNFYFDTEKEIAAITSFLKEVLYKTKKEKLVVASSGGIDSSVALALCVKAIGPHSVFVLSLPYSEYHKEALALTSTLCDQLDIPQENRISLPIDETVHLTARSLGVNPNDHIRLGNMMARVRMIYLYDQAKRLDGLVCGTENKSEYYLGYFTRFGDEASDIEPIRHLYKTQIYMLAHALSLPKQIIMQKPTAALWKDQTDEGEFGFSYEEADQVLALHFDKQIAFKDISITDFPNRDAIEKYVIGNEFKHRVPYVFKEN